MNNIISPHLKKEMPPAAGQHDRGQKGVQMTPNNNTTSSNNCKTAPPDDDEVKVTFFKGPASNTTPDDSDPIEWDDLSVKFSQPEQGPKDGSYFVRAECTGSRNDNNTDSYSSVIIIDGDDGSEGDQLPPPDYASDTLRDLEYQFILYTTFSHTPENPKYRIILLLDRKVNQAESNRLYRGIIDILFNNGLRIGKNSESNTWSQPFFFPRYETEEQRGNFFHSDGGYKRLPVDKILAAVPEKENASIAELSQDQIFKLKKSIPTCIEFFRNDTELETTEHRNFNLIKMVLVAYGLSAGLDENETVSLCREFIDNYSYSNSLKTPEARLSNFKKCYRSMKQSGCIFSCAAVRSLSDPGNAFECKECAVEKPHDVEDVLEWVDQTDGNKGIQTGWIEKTKDMDAVSTARIIRAVSQSIGVGLRPLNKDLKKQQEAWQREKAEFVREKETAEREANGKIAIYYLKTATGDIVKTMSKALASNPDLDCVYRFGSTLVRIVNARPSSVHMVARSHNNNGIYPSMPIINTLTIETLRHELEKVAFCLEIDKIGDGESVMWPNVLIKGLMDIPTSFEKPLISVVEHPYIDESFNPVMDQGYDPKTGLFKKFDFDNNFMFDKRITPRQSKGAYQYLYDEVMADFPFATTLDSVGAISTLLTAVQRKLITGDSGCPGYLFDAPEQSTGKTTLAQIISYSIYNRPVAATSWSNDDNELGKHILGILREGHSCVLFDNLASGTLLSSDELAKAMTSATYSKRLLGENITVTVPSSVLWLFTGNNISVAGDFNTRILSIRLDAKMADPDKRSFKRPDIGEWCLENRQDIIHACLTIILASKGVKTKLPPSRYNEWDKFVRHPLYLVTEIDIADLFKRNKDSDPQIEGQKQLLETWHNLLGSGPVAAREIIEAAKPGSHGVNTEICDAIQDIFGEKLPTTAVFGKWLRGLKGRVIGGYKVVAKKSDTTGNRNIWLWSVEKETDSD